MKMNEFCLGLHWSLFLKFELTISQHWFAWSAPSHYLNQWWLVYGRIYALLGLNGVKQCDLLTHVADCEIALLWMPQSTFYCKSTLVKVMHWCRHATSHYPNQFLSGSMAHVASVNHNELMWLVYLMPDNAGLHVQWVPQQPGINTL